MSKIVVDNICVFKTDDERLIEVPFDNASQICCEKGVHNKNIEGTEIECCGGSKFLLRSRVGDWITFWPYM